MAKKPAKNNADASGLGYSVHDFQYPKRDPNITPATFGIYDNPAMLNRQAMTPTISGVTIGQAGLGASGAVNPATINRLVLARRSQRRGHRLSLLPRFFLLRSSSR